MPTAEAIPFKTLRLSILGSKPLFCAGLVIYPREIPWFGSGEACVGGKSYEDNARISNPRHTRLYPCKTLRSNRLPGCTTCCLYALSKKGGEVPCALMKTDLPGFTAMASTPILCALGGAFAGSDSRTFLLIPFHPVADRSVQEECRPGDQECHRAVQ